MNTRLLLVQVFLLLAMTSIAQTKMTKVYYTKGNLKGMGMVNAENLRTGEWKFYSHRDTTTNIENKPESMSGLYENGVRVGIWNDYYPDGKTLSKARQYSDESSADYETYTYKTYRYDGTPLESGSIIENNKEGKFYTYHKNGAVNWDGNYVNNRKDGLWKAFFDDGTLNYKSSYKDGVKHGDHITFWSTDIIKSKRSYVDGKISGKWSFYDRNGVLEKTEEYMKNGNHQSTLYFEDGSIHKTGLLNSSKRIGQELMYFEDGSLRRETNFNSKGQLNDTTTAYNQDGNIKKQIVYDNGKIVYDSSKVNYKAKTCDEKDGLTTCTSYYQDTGNIRNIIVYNRQDISSSKKFYPDGTINRECLKSDDDVNSCTDYNKQGIKTSEVAFKKGKPYGTWYYYDIKGKVTRKEVKSSD